MSKKVVLVADDLGLSSEINRAIVHSHVDGALDAACLMMGQPGTGEAVELARAHPSLEVGWHLHLCDSQPVTAERWPWGASPARAGWSLGLSRAARELARQEIGRQWELFRATRLPCRFVNCHHHLHAHPFVYRTLLETIGPDFAGWIRLGSLRTMDGSFRPAQRIAFALANLFQYRRRARSRLPSPDTLWGVDRIFRMDAAEVRAAVADLPDGWHEFLFHPRTLSCQDTLCLTALRSSRSS